MFILKNAEYCPGKIRRKISYYFLFIIGKGGDCKALSIVFAKFLYFKKRSQGGAVQLYTMEFMFFPKYVSACDVLSGW